MYHNLSALKLSFQKLSQYRNRKTNSIISRASLIAVALSLFAPMGSAWAAGIQTFSKELTSGNTVDVGGLVAYKLNLGCSAAPSDCGTLKITDTLPAGMVIESCTAPSIFTMVQCTPGQTAIEIDKNTGFLGGDTFEITVVARVKLDTVSGTVLTNTATSVIGSASGAGNASVDSTAPPVTVKSTAPQWSLEKIRTSPAPPLLPTWDTDVSYTVSLCADTAIGNQSLTGVQLSDAFEGNANVVNFGSANASANPLVWDDITDAEVDLATLYAGKDFNSKQCISKSYTLTYPHADFDETSAKKDISNTISATNTSGAVIGPFTLDDVIGIPTPGANLSKSANDVLPNEDLIWVISANVNASNAPVPDLVIYETIPTLPAGVVPKSISSGQWNSPPITGGSSDVHATIDYSTTDVSASSCDAATTTYSTVLANNIPSPATSAVYSLTGTSVTCVRWQFYDVAGGGNNPVPRGWTFTDSPKFVQDTTTYHTNTGVYPIEVTNCVNARYTTFGQPAGTRDGNTGDICPTANIEEETPEIIFLKSKSVNNLSPFDETQYTLRFRHAPDDSTGPTINPVVIDLLPEEFEFISWDSVTGLGGENAPSLIITEDYNATGRTRLYFSWANPAPAGSIKLDGSDAAGGDTSASFAEGSDVRINFTARVKSGTPAGNYTNEAQYLDNSPRFSCDAGGQVDATDLDSDGITTEELCNVQDIAIVTSAAVLSGSKWIKGDPTLSHIDTIDPTAVNNAACPDDGNGFTRYPCVAQTTKGGDFEYLIKLKNVGNVKLKEYILYDVLPQLGDVGVGQPLSGSARATEWRPILTEAVSAVNAEAIAASAIIEYSIAANSCRPEVSSTGTEAPVDHWQAGCDNTWVAAPANLADVTAFRIRIPFAGPAWQISDEMHFGVKLKAPLAAPGSDVTNAADLHPAWNSFAHRVTKDDPNDSRLPTAEPRKVGIVIPKGPKVSIGSVVWADLNNNGAQAASEAGIDGVKVSLLYANGTPAADQDGVLIPSQLTQNGGQYYFDNMDEGVYKVQITTPAGGYIPSTLQTTADDDDSLGDSNIAGPGVPANTYVSGKFTLSDNGEPENADEASPLPNNGDNADAVDDNNGNMTVDFGFYLPVSIGSTVFYDLNNNGIQSGAGETGIPNTTVKLYAADGTTEIPVGPDGVLGTADDANGGMQTNASGNYFFSNLSPGNYVVGVIAPASAPTSSTDIATTNADNQVDGDDNGVQANSGDEAKSPIINLQFGAEPQNEAGQGGNQDVAADAAGDMTVDFGFVRPVSIGSVVWNDTNNNGIQDSGELGIENAFVELLDSGNNVVTSANTDPNGLYFFDGLPFGDYRVRVTPPAVSGFTPSAVQNNADNDDTANDSNIATSAGNVHTSGLFTLEAGNEPDAAAETGGLANSDNADNAAETRGNMTVDFGFFKVVADAVSIGSVVWNDTNNDGIQDSNENGLSGAVVTLINASGPNTGNPVIGYAPITTGANGLYYFGNLPAGDYQVKVELPVIYEPSAVQTTADNDDADNDSNIATSDTSGAVTHTHTSGVFTLSNNGEPLDANETGVLGGEQQDVSDDDNGNMTVDFGFFQPLDNNAVSIGSLVWFDDNDNGKQDDGEQPLAGATVKLLDDNGDRVAGITEQLTGADGLYFFDNLPAGNYRIEVTPPAGYEPSSIQNGASNDDTANDSNILSSAGSVHTSGIFALSVGGEPTETGGLAGSDDADNAAEANGNMTVDFGFNQPIAGNAVSIGSVLWSDTDMDGIQDGGEPTISGATVTLLHSNGTPVAGVSPQQTGSDGQYYFGNLPEGSYRVRVTVPTALNLVPTFVQEANADGNADNDSNIASSSDIIDGSNVVTDTVYTSGIVQLSNNAEPIEATGLAGSDGADVADDDNGNMTVDFGFVPKGLLGALSGNVSEDTNNDDLVDNVTNPNDPNNVDKPIEGVTLQLYTAAGQPVLDPITGQPVTTKTDANGNYVFTGLVPASYQVREIQPGGFASVSDIDPSDPLNDIIGDGAPIVVPAGGIAPDNNFIERFDPTAVPTLSEWSLILLMMMLGLVGIRQANLRGGVKF